MRGVKASDPVRPRGVRVILDGDGGQGFPARLSYNGQEPDGVTCWVAHVPAMASALLLAGQARLLVDELPPKTTLLLRVDPAGAFDEATGEEA